ncbi:MAG: DUF192 domain-containing protein [Spirochaetales bacterium]
MITWRHVALLVALVLVTAAGCSQDTVTYQLTIGSSSFSVEVVDTPATRARGLMERAELAPDAGMLFVFESSERRSFWMKDTLLPLSIAYIDADRIIREMYDMQPLSTVPVPSRLPARYALEVNQGAFEERGIAVGDRLEFSPALERRIERGE